MNGEHHGSVVNSELFISSDRLLAPDIMSHMKPRKAMNDLLVAFVLVGTPKMIDSDKLSQGIPKVDDFTTLVDGVVYNFLDDGTLSEDTE